MANVQLQPQQDAVEAGAAVRVGDSRALWILLALFLGAVAVAATMVVLTNDDQPVTRTVTRTFVVPVDVAAAQAMKDEGAAAAAVGEAVTGVEAVPVTESAKIEAANHALSVRSIGLQQMLADDPNSDGTNAKDEAGVAAAIGKSNP